MTDQQPQQPTEAYLQVERMINMMGGRIAELEGLLLISLMKGGAVMVSDADVEGIRGMRLNINRDKKHRALSCRLCLLIPALELCIDGCTGALAGKSRHHGA